MALEEKYSPENTNVIFTYKNTDFEVNGADFDLKYDLDKTSENAYQAGKGKNFISRGFNAVKYSLDVYKRQLSVHMQTDGMLSKYSLSLKKYVSAKFIHSVFAFVYALIAIKIVPLPFKTFSSAFEKTAVSLNIASLVCLSLIHIYI